MGSISNGTASTYSEKTYTEHTAQKGDKTQFLPLQKYLHRPNWDVMQFKGDQSSTIAMISFNKE